MTKHDLTGMIQWETPPALKIAIASNGDQYVLPPYLSYFNSKSSGEGFCIQIPEKYGKFYEIFKGRKHTDESGRISLYWAYKHAMDVLICIPNYNQISLEGAYISQFETGKLSKKTSR